MSRISTPREGEPIRLVSTATGPRYRVVLDVAPRGAPRRQVTRTVDTLSEARAFVTATRASLAAGTFAAPSRETLDALCARWLDTWRNVRPVTVQGYRDVLRPVLRRLGSREVQTLTVADVEALTEWLAREGGQRGQGLSPRTVRGALVALSQALDMAMREDTVTRNVARLVKRPRKARTVDPQRWTPAQVAAFRATADGDPLAAAWRLTLCGLRRSEVLGLRWCDVDLSAGVVRVVQGRVAVTPTVTHIDGPKNDKPREVPVEALHAGTVDALRALRAVQVSHPLLGLSYVDRGLLVTDEAGRPMRPEAYSDRFRRLCVEAGVPVIRLHAVRHSLADRLAALNVPPVDAAALLGHTTEVYYAVYARATPAGVTEAAQVLGRALAAES